MACLAIFAFAGVRASADEPILAADRPLDMRHIRLDLDVDLERKHVGAVATLTMTPLRTVEAVTLDAVDFELGAVRLAVGAAEPAGAKYEYDDKRLVVDFGEQLAPGAEITLTVRYEIDHPKSGLHFFAPTDDDPDIPLQMWSQGQSISNRYWIPCFDHPNERQTTEIVATVDERFRVLSNGRLISKKASDSGRMTYHWLQDKPHVIYLVTLVVGEFAVKEEQWRGIPVSYWVPPDKQDQIDNSFGNTPAMLDCFSDKIGVKYPWDQYVQVCCYQFGGGMENTSATTLGQGTLHDDRAHLDNSSDGLVAHELAHQWFGDLLTCRDWAHVWLNEGFASYFEAVWDEHHNGPDAYAYNMYQKAGRARSGGADKPIVYRHYERPDEQFDARAYPKGAWVLHMLRCRLGDETFWKVMNRYTVEFAGDVVETADFRRVAERVSGQCLERFFYDWTERPGHPELEVELKWDEDGGVAEVAVKQAQEAEAFHFPLKLEFRVAGQREPVVLVHDLTTKEATYSVPLPAKPTMFRVDPGNTVLKTLKETKDEELWRAQLTDDPDPIGRLRAIRRVAKSESDESRDALVRAMQTEKFWAVRGEIADELGKLESDAARDALLAGARDEEPRVRRACVAALGGFGDDDSVATVLRTLVVDGDPSYNVEAAAIAAYAKLKPGDLLDVLQPVLDRDSHREVIRSAAIDAIGGLDGDAPVAALLTWAGPDKPGSCRRAAVRGLRKLVERDGLDRSTTDRGVLAIAGCLEGGDRRLRSSAARTLGDLGERAAAALPALRRVARQDGNDRLKRAAQAAIEKIEEEWTLEDQVADLRDMLDRLMTENESLHRRLDELEGSRRPSAATVQASDSSGPAEAQPAAAGGRE